MPESTTAPTKEPSSSNGSSSWISRFLLLALIPLSASFILYQLDSFDPAPLPLHEIIEEPVSAPKRNGRMLLGSEKLGLSRLAGPEDLIYEPQTRTLITGCADGWIKRIKMDETTSELMIDDVYFTGGRPLGLALGHHGNIIAADAVKGLLNLSADGKVELLTDEADGLKFKLTDGVAVAKNGVVYFTDASSKYGVHQYIWDFLEGRPYGRLMSYDPLTKATKVLLNNLYFPNGVALSPDQTHVIYCESGMLRCRKYYIEGDKKGTVEKFVQLPGLPDNIHHDGNGHYYIALAAGTSKSYELFTYPVVRKISAMLEKIGRRPSIEKNAGLIIVDEEGNPDSHYYDAEYQLPSSAVKIGDCLYFGSVAHPYILRLNITQYPALPVA